jgi:hypothetical protein
MSRPVGSAWHHTHEFEPDGGGTIIRDLVRYRLPFGALGEQVAAWLVSRDLEAVFAFRRRRIQIQQAAMAVATGVARTVVVYRALNERSGDRFGAGIHDRRKSVSPGPSAGGGAATYAWDLPFGLVPPAAWVAMCTTRYMHEFGATSEDFGRVAVAARRQAATNPAAWFHGKPITLTDHQASR